MVVEHDDRTWIVAIHDLASADRALLRRPLGDLSAQADALERAVERLFTGF